MIYMLIAACKTNLLGRLLLRKGSKPLKVEALKASLQTLWQPTAAWQLVPLARGYYDIHFGTEEDMRRVWSNETCSLDSGIFRLFQWKPDLFSDSENSISFSGLDSNLRAKS